MTLKKLLCKVSNGNSDEHAKHPLEQSSFVAQLGFKLIDFHVEPINVTLGGKCIVQRLGEYFLLGTNKRFGLWLRDTRIAQVFDKLMGIESDRAHGLALYVVASLYTKKPPLGLPRRGFCWAQRKDLTPDFMRSEGKTMQNEVNYEALGRYSVFQRISAYQM